MTEIVQLFIYMGDNFFSPLFSSYENLNLFEEEDKSKEYVNHILLNNPQLFRNNTHNSWKITRNNLNVVLANCTLSEETRQKILNWQ